MGGACCVGDFLGCCIGDFHLPCLFDSGCCVGNSCCVGNASGPSESEQHAKKVADELADMKERIHVSTSQQENEIIDYINQSMNVFMKEIEQLNKQSFAGEYLKINTSAIKKKNEELKSRVVGCVGNVMDERLVQTDKELSAILEERKDKKSKKNFEAFIKRVKKDALEQFKKEVEKTVASQSKVVSDEIRIRKKEVKKRLEESIKEMTAIMEIKEKNDAELVKKQIGYMYQISLCDFLINEAAG